MSHDAFAARLRLAMQSKELNQSELARAMHVAPQTVQQWTSAVTAPYRRRMIELAGILKVKHAWLSDGEGPMTDEASPATTDSTGVARAYLSAVQALARDLPWDQQINLGPYPRTFDILTDEAIVELSVATESKTILRNTRHKLWSLAVAHAAHPTRRVGLVLCSDGQLAGSEHLVAALQWEATTLHIPLRTASSTDQCVQAIRALLAPIPSKADAHTYS